MDTALLLWGLLFGGIGFVYYVYGKKQKRYASLVCGIGLFVLPYFISNVMFLVGAGVALMVVPFIYKK